MFRAFLKTSLQHFLKCYGLKITHNRNDHFSPDINLLPLLCKQLFSNSEPTLAIQIGANDGGGQDPFADVMELYPSMKIVLVEPLEPSLSLLRKKWEGNSRVTILPVAIGETTGKKPIYRVSTNSNSNVSHRLSEIASFDRSTIEKQYARIRAAREHIVTDAVDTLSVPDLIENVGKTTPDILQIDTEGYDAKIVMEFLKTNARPPVINYEHIHLSERDDDDCLRMLKQYSYKLIRCGRDTIAILAD